MQEAWR